MSRDPLSDVRSQLRKEVGFGCPVPGCGNPYLEWHHFDPPWRDENHHSPSGMIALCRLHHIQADNGAFTTEQLRQFKRDAANIGRSVEGKFNWLRNRLLVYAGGNHYLDTYEIFKFRGQPIIWFNRDKDGYLMLNMQPPTGTREQRFVMEDNFWIAHGNQEDLECPPSGRLLCTKYPNGDKFRVEFFECKTTEELQREYPRARPELFEIDVPVTVAEVSYRLAEAGIDFTPRGIKVGGLRMKGGFFESCQTAISL
jgi:hypothetical protein